MRKSRRSNIVIPKSISNQKIHRFTKYADSVLELIPSNGGNSIVAYELTFNLADVTAQAELVTLFDQYRIRAVSVQLTPAGQFITNDRTVTGAAGLDTEGTGYWIPPMLYAVIDYNDNNSLASLADAQEYSTCRIIPYRKSYSSFYFTPCVNMEVAESSTTTARAATKYAPWISTDSANVLHYGMKFLVHNPNANNVASSYGLARWNLRYKYYLECKNVK